MDWKIIQKKKKSKPYILFTMILSTISCLFPFRKKDVERSARCFRFQYPLRREISNSATSHRETFKLRPRSDWYYATMYLHRSHAPMASCRVGSHRSTTLEDESISFRTKRLCLRTDRQIRGRRVLPFVVDGTLYFTADTSYLTPHRQSLFQYSREKSIDEVTYNYTPAKID